MLRLFLLCAPFLLLGGFIVFAQRPESPAQLNQSIRPIDAPAIGQTLRANRIREGTAFKDMHVFFRSTGDQTVLWTVEDNRRFECLKNLALDRILTAWEEKPEREYWKIEGEFTEFRGKNFVLIRNGIIAQPPATQPPATFQGF